MQNLNTQLFRGPIVRSCVEFIGLVCVMSLVAGCATGRKVEPEPVKSLDVAEETAVRRLEDGRDGFIISEPSTIDSELRNDFEQAVSMMKDREFDKAIVLFENVIEQLPNVTAPHINVSMAYRQTGAPELAEEHLKAALELVPGHPVASNEYGLLLRQDGRFEEARTIYEKALSKFPEYLPVRRNLGILCDLYLDDQACALEQYEIYSEAKPEDEQVSLWIADLRMRTGSN